MMSAENFRMQWKKKIPVKYKEKIYKTHITAKEKKKVKINFKLITEVTSKEGNWKKGNTIL